MKFCSLIAFVFCLCLSFGVQAFDLKEMENKALAGDVEASSALGKYYYEIEKETGKALKWIKPAAEAGDAQAKYYLAEIYDNSLDEKYSNEEIIALLTASAEQGYTLAQIRLGEVYRFGRKGIFRDLEKARLFFNLAAAKGSSEAMQQLQFIYEQSGSRKVNEMQASEDFQWLELGAKQGDGEASMTLAKKLELGDGIKQDYVRAAQLYEQAVKAGVIEAKAQLGNLYANGEGVEKDSKKAVLLLTDAAEHGFVEAQRKLASVYTHDYTDNVQAYAWQLIALSAMFPESQNLVSVSPDFERLMRSMTADEIKDGQQLAVKLVEKIKANKKKK